MDNWLINLLALVLLAVVLDGARRAWFKHRDSLRNNVRVSRKPSRSARRERDDDYGNDILSGPRVVAPVERPSPRVGEDLKPKVHDVTREPAREPVRGTEREAMRDPEREWFGDDESDFGPALADEPLEYIDPEEAERRRQIAAELPGTVRVVQRRKPEDASQINRQVQQNFHSSRKPLAGSRPERGELEVAANASPPRAESRPEQASLNLDEQVPMLMDSVVDADPGCMDEVPREEARAHSRPSPADNHFSQAERDVEIAHSDGDPLASPAEEPVADGRREPSLDESASLDWLQTNVDEPSAAGEEMFAEVDEDKPNTTRSLWASAEIKLPQLKFPDLKKAAAPARASKEKPDAPAKGRSGKREATARKERAVEEVLILNIMAQAGDYFEGNDLLRALFASGMRFGDMNIFHYHTGEDGEGPALFSLANIVVPGTFDMSAMEDFTTPGVSLFLALPAEEEALKAFNTLLATTRYIAEQLGGELKDENRSVFTAQTAEHYRQRVMEFQRRKALAKARA